MIQPETSSSSTLSEPTVSIIVPIFNEVELLPVVLSHLRRLPIRMELVLVNDGSTDGTEQLLVEEAQHFDTKVLHHKTNKGKGAAIVTGLRAATGDVIIVQDADMEYDPNDILKVIAPIIEGKTNVCFGSRFLGDITGMRLPNRVANYLLAFFISVMFGQNITDEATAYKAFRKDIIKKIPLKCQGFEFCPEVTAKVMLMGEKIMEVPVTYRARSFDEGKKIGYKDFFIAINTMLSCKFRRN